MFKKIRSNRDPKHTIFSELRNEFGAYYRIEALRFKILMRKYPKQAFAIMVILMTLSVVLSFTLLDHKIPASIDHPQLKTEKKTSGNQASIQNNFPQVDQSFNSVLQLGANLKATYSIKKEIDSIMAKPSLTKLDSISLEKALDKLQHINHSLNH